MEMESRFLEIFEDLKAEKNALIVLRGFNFDFLKKVSKFVKSAFDLDLFEDKYIDLKKLQNNKRSMQKQLFLIEEGIYFARYEEFLTIKDSIHLYENKIYLIENNFINYEKYPLDPSDPELIEYIKFYDNETNLDVKESVFENYFGHIKKSNDEIWVISKSVDEKEISNLKKIDFFPKDEIDDHYKKYMEQSPKNNSPKEEVILYPNKDEFLILESLKERILYDESLKEVKLAIEKIINRDPIAKRNLNLLLDICEKNEINVFFHEEQNEEIKEYRDDFLNILNKHWKSREFRKLNFYSNPDYDKEKIEISQGEIIEDIVSQIEGSKKTGKSNDIFITAPTGAGKSIFFQIPAIYIKEKYNYLTIVISPLKALMKDQIDNLKDKGIEYACFINSDITHIEREKYIEKIKSGEISLVYLSPELLQINSNIENIIGDREIGCIVIDEAHTVSTWGKNFRVDYLLIGNYVNKIKKKQKYQFPIIALTATAIYNGPNDTVFEIISSLGIKFPKLYIGEVKKENIGFDIRKFDIQDGNYDYQKLTFLEKSIEKKLKNGKKTIIYFPYAKHVEENYLKLDSKLKPKVAYYTGRSLYEEKIQYQEEFKSGEKKIMMATKAFGMGIDIPDIENVYHYAPSGDLSDYVQEIGRCARKPGIIGKAEIDFNRNDLKYFRILRNISGIRQWQMKLVIEKLNELYRLNKMKSNMLVSIESFGHIFNEKEQALEKKVKQSLLFLERDLLEKYTYPVIIARPKAFFSSAYVVINKENELEILDEKNSPYFKKIYLEEQNRRVKKTYGYNGNMQETLIRDTGDIFEFDLSKYWEEKYQDISYPQFIREFFNGKIFDNEKLSSRIKLKIELDASSVIVMEKLGEYFDIINKIILELKGYFDKNQFENSLAEKLPEKNKNFAKKITNILFAAYTFIPDQNGKFKNTEKFIRIRKDLNKTSETYIFMATNFSKLRSSIIRRFREMFDEGNDKREFLKYINKDSQYLEVATLVEAFNLGSFEILGGDSPKIFIRINDPSKLDFISKTQYYNNSILSNIEKTGKLAEEILEEFFTSEMNDEERWEYIEDYFLGR